MQYQMYASGLDLSLTTSTTHEETYVQDSTDTENVFLVVIYHMIRDSRVNGNAYIKGHGKFVDVMSLIDVLLRKGIDSLSMVRLYCLSGNDFNHSSNVASMHRLITTYLEWHQKIGDLSTSTSVQALFFFFYLSFLRSTKPGGRFPPEIESEPIMSPNLEKADKGSYFWQQKCQNDI